MYEFLSNIMSIMAFSNPRHYLSACNCIFSGGSSETKAAISDEPKPHEHYLSLEGTMGQS